jgi:hypothetical protein
MLAGFLVVGGLLCIAPTLQNLGFEGWGLKINVAKSIIDTKEDLGSQIAGLRGQIAKLESKAGLSATSAGSAQPTILISYDLPRKALGKKIEAELLKKGHSANAVYDDLIQVQTKRPAGTNAIVYTEAASSTAKRVLDELKGAAPDFSNVVSTQVNSLETAPIQIRLF